MGLSDVCANMMGFLGIHKGPWDAPCRDYYFFPGTILGKAGSRALAGFSGAWRGDMGGESREK